ncbi:tRNA pseudouridine(38-40) synthase TruA [Flavobacteriaceae bacterium AU392]|nr:tRNA pseudouridine(38-40) synthase TruA [Flavobacteriaceae bacterium]RKM81275.1 tRNA pseudouridine(38-40) synthase TruA [Flavobacteriaceae bacterium AU392]
MRYFIELSYNGKAYHGWQNQPNAITVQEILENALSLLFKEKIEVIGAGRTDAGVHALQMFAHFDTDNKFEIETLKFKLNSFLPKDIAIHDITLVKTDAHTRFDALSREYIYRVSLKKDVFAYEGAYYLKHFLDIEKMNAAAKLLFEYEDFKCFSRSNTDVKTYNCTIMKALWERVGDELVFTIKANRFLRNMVRAIVGTMINIGTGKMEVEELHTVIKSKNRSKAGASVPGYALYLSKIEYPNNLSEN